MYKKLFLALLIGSPLLAVGDAGPREATDSLPEEEIMNRRSEKERQSHLEEDLECCLCFLPRVAIFGSLAVIVAGALTFEAARVAGRLTIGVAKGALERVKSKTD